MTLMVQATATTRSETSSEVRERVARRIAAPEGADEWIRGDGLHPGRRAQPAGALDRDDPRRPGEGSAGRALPHHSRHARRRGRERAQAVALQVWGQAAQGGSVMSRRKKAVRRPVPADPRYDSQTVSKFLNNLMERGKKSLAERVFYSAMDLIEQRTGQPGVNVFKQALSNVKPALEVKSRRVGGATYQVPVEVRPERRTALGMRWLISFSRARREKNMAERLAAELILASKGEGETIKKKEDTHRMAEANRAFAHYRW